MKLITATTLFALIAAPALSAGKIERACNASDRPASRATCKCIQKVANGNLSRSDQKLAAKFFKDPAMAQVVRQSDDARKEAFWKRYKLFGTRAAQSCKK